MVSEHPEKIGRLNDLDVSINEVSVKREEGQFSIEMSGQANTGITTGSSDSGGTPTQTPLPMGHFPFEAAYTVSERGVRREGTVYECW